MGRTFSRDEILGLLRASVAQGVPVLAAGSCNGIAAKYSVLGGADLIISSTVGQTRSMGFPSRVIEDFGGRRSLTMREVLWQVVHDVPLVTALDVNDIQSLDHERLRSRRRPRTSLGGPGA